MNRVSYAGVVWSWARKKNDKLLSQAAWEAGGMVVARRFCLVGARDCVYKGFMEEVSSGWASKAE